MDVYSETRTLMNGTVPKLKYAGEAREGNKTLVQKLVTVETTTA